MQDRIKERQLQPCHRFWRPSKSIFLSPFFSRLSLAWWDTCQPPDSAIYTDATSNYCCPDFISSAVTLEVLDNFTYLDYWEMSSLTNSFVHHRQGFKPFYDEFHVTSRLSGKMKKFSIVALSDILSEIIIGWDFNEIRMKYVDMVRQCTIAWPERICSEQATLMHACKLYRIQCLVTQFTVYKCFILESKGALLPYKRKPYSIDACSCTVTSCKHKQFISLPVSWLFVQPRCL